MTLVQELQDLRQRADHPPAELTEGISMRGTEQITAVWGCGYLAALCDVMEVLRGDQQAD